MVAANAAASAGGGTITISGPSHNAFHVRFNQVVTGTASGLANYVVSFEQTPARCASTFVLERRQAGSIQWPTGTGPVHGRFHLVARFYSRNHNTHAICSYLINRATFQTFAHASHRWSNA